jgi:hypothetical protein
MSPGQYQGQWALELALDLTSESTYRVPPICITVMIEAYYLA